MKWPRPAVGATRIPRPVPVVALAVAVIAAMAVLVTVAIVHPGNDGGLLRTAPPAAVQTPDLEPAAAFAAHVDATFNTLSQIFQDAEGASFEQFAGDAEFAATEEAWISSQPRVPCLTAAVAQYAAAVASLKAAMDASVADYESGNPDAIASLNAKADPARTTLLIAKEAVDEAAARC